MGMSIEPATVLRASDLRITKQRVAVMSTLESVPHSDADTVLRLVRDDLGQVSTQAIYDVLNTLTGRGILRRIQPAGSAARYELSGGKAHHHAVCRGCGAVYDIPFAHTPYVDTTGLGNDFTADETEVIVWGTCASCASTDKSTTDS